MLNSNKGISLITLVMTIIVLIILLSITISSSIKSIDETNVTKIENEMANLKEAVNERMVNHEKNGTQYPLIGEKIGDQVFDYLRLIKTLDASEIDEIIDKINEGYSVETADYYRLIKDKGAKDLGIDGFDSKRCYVVDYMEGNVYGPIETSLIP